MNQYNILIINPGSTSDEVGYYEGDKEKFHKVMRYDAQQLEPFTNKKITDQFKFRKDFVLKELKDHGIKPGEIDAVIARGGLLKPIPGGTYEVNDKLKEELKNEVYGTHASNLGALIADSIAKETGKKAYIADPPVVDEMMEIARYSGVPQCPRISIFHCLNQRRVGYLVAKKLNREYRDLNLVIAHMGGGITVGAHSKGRVIDVNNGLDGDGPFTPQRSGTFPAGSLLKLCFSGKYTQQEIKLMITGKGGILAYTGTSDMKLLEKYAGGEEISEEERKKITPPVTSEQAGILIDAMSYQVSKEISSLFATFFGKVDAIILSGGLAYSKRVIDEIEKRTGWMAPVYVIPGGDEIRALKDACERVLTGKEICKEYI